MPGYGNGFSNKDQVKIDVYISFSEAQIMTTFSHGLCKIKGFSRHYTFDSLRDSLNGALMAGNKAIANLLMTAGVTPGWVA